MTSTDGGRGPVDQGGGFPTLPPTEPHGTADQPTYHGTAPTGPQGQPGQQQPAGYPSYPSYPAGPGGGAYPGYSGYPDGEPAGPPPTRPATLEWAFRLMLLRALLSLVGLVSTIAMRDSLRDQIVRQQQLTGRNANLDVDTLVNVAVGIGVVFGIVFTVLYVLLAFQVRHGKQWARVVTWVVAGLGVLSLLSAFATNGTGVSRTISVVGGLIDLTIIVLLALRATSAYVDAVRVSRRR